MFDLRIYSTVDNRLLVVWHEEELAMLFFEALFKFYSDELWDLITVAVNGEYWCKCELEKWSYHA